MHRPEEFIPLTPLSLAVLLALADGSLHGYGIIKAIERQSERRLRPGAGSLYAALDRMQSGGLIEARTEEVTEGQGRRRFALSELGRRVALAELRRLQRLIDDARARGFAPESA